MIRIVYTAENVAEVLGTTTRHVKLLAKLQILPIACQVPLRFFKEAIDTFLQNDWPKYRYYGLGRRKGIWAD